MLTKTVLVVPIAQMGPNGDRDRERHPYFDYQIHVIDNVQHPTKDTKVHEVRGFDNFNSHILPKDRIQQQAMDFANQLALKFGATARMGTEKDKPDALREAVVAWSQDQGDTLDVDALLKIIHQHK